MPVKVYKSTDQGAPPLNGIVGSLAELLDQVLVTGYGDFPVTSISSAGTKATVTCSSTHGLVDYDWVLLSGAVEPEYTGEFAITVIDDLSFSIAVSATHPVVASGTVIGKKAPAGFDRPFISANGFKRAWRSKDLSARRHYFQLTDDSASFTGGALIASMIGYTHMVGIDAGSGMFPYRSQFSRGVLTYKSLTADATPRAWVIISDGISVYATLIGRGVVNNFNENYHRAFGFGELAGAADDPWASYICGDVNDSISSSSLTRNGWAMAGGTGGPGSNFNAGMVIARGPSGNTGPSVDIMLLGIGGHSDGWGISRYLPGFSRIEYNSLVGNVKVVERGNGTASSGTPMAVYRGRLPGMYDAWQGRNNPNLEVYNDFEGLEGRRLMVVYSHASGNGHSTPLFDITGPWD